MSRKPTVRYYSSRGGYFTCVNGRQHRLAVGPDDGPAGPTFLAAIAAYKQILELGNVATSKDGNTVRAVCESYLQATEGSVQPRTLALRLAGLVPFADALGDVRIADLTPAMVEAFIASQRVPRLKGPAGKQRLCKWGDAAAARFLEAAAAAFNWAVRQRHITFNPVAGIAKPTDRSNARDLLVSPELHQTILKESRAATFRRLLVALENTGARPSELVAATASAWDDENGTINYYSDRTRKKGEHRHKTAKRKDRVIFFTGEALAMMRELVKEHPTGPLFRTKKGKGYSVAVVVNQFKHIRERLGLDKLTAYSYRHTFATNWLLSGRNVDVLASLLGNSPAVIRRSYSHLLSDKTGIRNQLEGFK